MIRKPVMFAIVSLFAVTSTALADTKLIHAGELLAVPGERSARNQTIIIKDDRIVEVRNGYADASEFDGAVQVIDLRNRFVMPGLMDMHVHLQGELGPKNDSEDLKMSSQLMQMRSIYFAMKTLRAGFTTVRDVGSSSQEMYAMRDAINAGWIDRITHGVHFLRWAVVMNARSRCAPAKTISRGSSPTHKVCTTLGGLALTSTTLTLSDK